MQYEIRFEEGIIMKFAVMSFDFKRLTLETTFKLASEYGFDGLEIYGSRFPF